MAKNLVYQATSDDDKPPSGYILKELADMSKISIADSETIESSVLSRLKKNSPNIKWKCLKVIKYLSVNGRVELSRGFQKHHEDIREAINFVGKPHPVHGDDLNERVRAAAKEALTAVFAGPVGPSSSDYELKAKISGIEGGPMSSYSGGPPPASGWSMGSFSLPSISFPGGSSSSSTPSYGSGASKLPGMGNPHYAPDAPSGPPETVVGKMMAYVPTFGFGSKASSDKYSEYPTSGPYAPPVDSAPDTFRPPYPGATGGYPGASGGYPGASGGYPGATGGYPSGGIPTPTAASPYRPAAPAKSASPVVTVRKPRKKGQVGGGWDDDSDASPARGPASSEYTDSPAIPTSAPGTFGGLDVRSAAPSAAGPFAGRGRPAPGTRKAVVASGAVETGLVNELCAAAGVKAEPPKEKLNQLITALPSLDKLSVFNALNEKLKEEEKWQVQKKALIVIETLMAVEADYVTDFFQENPENLASLITSPQTSVSQKARKLLSGFGITVEVEGGDPGAGSDITPIASPPVVPEPEPATTSAFSFIDSGASTTAPAPLFAGVQVVSPPKPAVTPSVTDDLLFSVAAPSGVSPMSSSSGVAAPVSAPAPSIGFSFTDSPAPSTTTSAPVSAPLGGLASFLSDPTPGPSAESKALEAQKFAMLMKMGGSGTAAPAPAPTTAPTSFPGSGAPLGATILGAPGASTGGVMYMQTATGQLVPVVPSPGGGFIVLSGTPGMTGPGLSAAPGLGFPGATLGGPIGIGGGAPTGFGGSSFGTSGIFGMGGPTSAPAPSSSDPFSMMGMSAPKPAAPAAPVKVVPTSDEFSFVKDMMKSA